MEDQKVIIFWDKFVTFKGPLSLLVGLCTLYQIHQENLGMGQAPPTLFSNARIEEAYVNKAAPHLVKIRLLKPK